ncbi:hypothetical protein PIB30_019456 [Stylosanthes scabra]|uniref:Uncharacterized protein n=1 Tax=Stylosanthes scabra TaxID=79078 RepID=A0ABU6S8I7_9FABA|nr:hypothetical protein [Stylosanthes scabra]
MAAFASLNVDGKGIHQSVARCHGFSYRSLKLHWIRGTLPRIQFDVLKKAKSVTPCHGFKLADSSTINRRFREGSFGLVVSVMAEENSFLALVHHDGEIKHNLQKGVKFTSKNPTNVFITPRTRLLDLQRNIQWKICSNGRKRIGMIYYRIPISVMAQG